MIFNGLLKNPPHHQLGAQWHGDPTCRKTFFEICLLTSQKYVSHTLTHQKLPSVQSQRNSPQENSWFSFLTGTKTLFVYISLFLTQIMFWTKLPVTTAVSSKEKCRFLQKIGINKEEKYSKSGNEITSVFATKKNSRGLQKTTLRIFVQLYTLP